MTSSDILLFLNLLELEDYADIKPEDTASVLRTVEPLVLDDLYLAKYYTLVCEDCHLEQRWKGENLLDAVCIDCGSHKVRRV